MSSRRFTSPRGKKLTGLAKKYPLARGAPGGHAVSSPLPSSRSGHVLLAAACPQLVETTTAVLAEAGHRIATASDVDEALRAMTSERFDLLIIAPIPGAELLLQLATLRRVARASAEPRESLTLAGLHMDFAAHQVFVGDRLVDLTAAEFRMLRTLAEAEGRLCSRGALAATSNARAASRGIDMRISRIRRKLAGAGLVIDCVRGEGYRLSRDRGGTS